MTLKEILTPRGFLTVGGVALLLVAVLSFLHITGPTPENSIFGAAWYFDGAENVAHLVLGVVALVAVFFLKDKGIHKFLVVAVGALCSICRTYESRWTRYRRNQYPRCTIAKIQEILFFI